MVNQFSLVLLCFVQGQQFSKNVIFQQLHEKVEYVDQHDIVILISLKKKKNMLPILKQVNKVGLIFRDEKAFYRICKLQRIFMRYKIQFIF